MTLIKTYTGEPPLNSAAIIPGKPYVRPLFLSPSLVVAPRGSVAHLCATRTRQVVMGGGQEAMNVTTTGARQGHFEVRFFHRIFEEEVSRVKGGFGPCNSVAVHPQGKGYAIGGEDGCVFLSPSHSLPLSHACAALTLLLARALADVRVHEFDKSWFDARPYGPLEPEED